MEHIIENLYVFYEKVRTADLPKRLLNGINCEVLLENVVQKHIQHVYQSEGQNKTKAAKLLGISVNTLKVNIGKEES